MIEVLTREIKKAARSVAFEWPGVVEADDIEQSIWEHILVSPKTKDDLLEMEATPRYRTISKIGHRIASKERTDYEYFSGNFRYSVNEVKALLSKGAINGTKFTVQSGWSSEENVSSGGEFEDAVLTSVSMEADLQRAMEMLKETTPQYHDILIRKYVTEEYLASGADKKRATLALNALTDNMNRSHKQRHVERPDGPGTRKLVSTKGSEG
ncbi:RNA polymerase sigma factor [Mycobacterium phage GaugeLDP]|nr:RNA polymerase sigma factor [Mycobacterium phage GaugeLDP]